eukprot:EG_transcript_7220
MLQKSEVTDHDFRDEEWDFVGSFLQDLVLERDMLEVEDAEQAGRDRVSAEERSDRQHLLDQLEWLDLSANQIRRTLQYEGMWQDMMDVLRAVQTRERGSIMAEAEEEFVQLQTNERMALGKLQFRRNFDLMLQEMEATLLVLEVKRRTRLVTLEDKEWSAMQGYLHGRSPRKVPTRTRISATRLGKAGRPADKPRAAPRSRVADAACVPGVAGAYALVASGYQASERLPRGTVNPLASSPASPSSPTAPSPRKPVAYRAAQRGPEPAPPAGPLVRGFVSVRPPKAGRPCPSTPAIPLLAGDCAAVPGNDRKGGDVSRAWSPLALSPKSALAGPRPPTVEAKRVTFVLA